MDLGPPGVLGPESAYRMNHAPVHQPWNRNGSHHDGFPSNGGGDVLRDASYRPPNGTAAYGPSTAAPASALNSSIGAPPPTAAGGFPRTVSFSPPMSPFRMSPPSTHYWQQPLPPPLTPLTPLSQTPAPAYPASAFGPIGPSAGPSSSTAALRHQGQQQQSPHQFPQHQRQRYGPSPGANGTRPATTANGGFAPDSSADEMTDASPSPSDGSADDGASPAGGGYRHRHHHRRQEFSPTALPSLPSRGGGTGGAGNAHEGGAGGGGGGGGGGRSALPTSTSARRGGGGARDEFDGPTQLLPRPGSGSGPAQTLLGGGLGGGLSSLLDQQQQQQQQQHPQHHHHPPLRALPELPTHLRVQEQDEVLAAVNARLSQCAFDFVARYQFPIPCTPDMRPVQGPQDREWSEWVHLLRRLATRRRIPARVLYQGQIRQLVTVLENSLEMRHAGRAQSSRPPRDDRNVLQLISAGLQVARILQDAPAMEFLDHLYVSTDHIIQNRTAAEACLHD